MANRSWRPAQEPEQRQAEWFRAGLPGAIKGESPNPFGRSMTAAALGALQNGDEDDDAGVSHIYETLKAAGVAPGTEYGLTYTPIPSPDGSTKWPLVVAGGVEQVESIDYTCEGNLLTILPAMDLRTNELLWCRYDYNDAVPNPSTQEDYTGPTIVGTPWGWTAGPGSSGTRTVYFRLEGLDVVTPGVNPALVQVEFGQGGTGAESFDWGPGEYAINCTDQGYQDNIWRQSLTRPYYGQFEVPFTRINVEVGEYYGGPRQGALNDPVLIDDKGYNNTTPPPLDYQG